jgi:hypothetical protein
VSKNGLKNSREEWLREEKEKLQESRKRRWQDQEIADGTHTGTFFPPTIIRASDALWSFWQLSIVASLGIVFKRMLLGLISDEDCGFGEKEKKKKQEDEDEN